MEMSGCKGEAGAGHSGQGRVTPALGAGWPGVGARRGGRSWAYKDPLGLSGLQCVVGGLRGRQDGEGAAGVPGTRELPSTWENPSLPGKNPGNIRGTGIRCLRGSVSSAPHQQVASRKRMRRAWEDARGRSDGRRAGSHFPRASSCSHAAEGRGNRPLVTPALLIPHPSAPPRPASLSLRVVCTRSFSFPL